MSNCSNSLLMHVIIKLQAMLRTFVILTLSWMGGHVSCTTWQRRDQFPSKMHLQEGLIKGDVAVIKADVVNVQCHSLFTLISYYAIVFSFAQIFTDSWFTLLRDGFLYCFCLLAESYETVNHTINHPDGKHGNNCNRDQPFDKVFSISE